MQSTSESSTRTPISTVPFDVLSEIFAHSLPEYPLKLEEQQPNIKSAPMLLCRICSSWRSTALAWPTLWRNLCFRVTVSSNEGGPGIPCAFVESEIDFIRWWRKNQGSMAPFLNLSVIYSIHEMSPQAEEDRAETMEFLIEYIKSAEYLRLDRFFWSRLHERCAGSMGDGGNIHYSGEAFELTDALPALRRLSISGGIMVSKLTNCIPLTHVSLDYISLPTSVWFSLIRALPDLQCGYFNIKYINNRERFSKPPPCTLLRLSMLCVVFCLSREYSDIFSIHNIFTNLHLPSLRTLSLLRSPSQDHHSSGSDNTVTLYVALKSVPAVTTLVLADCFLGLVSPDFSQGPTEPIWHHLPHLLEIQLEVPHGGSYPLFERSKKEVEAELDVFVRDIMFAEGNWLDLRNPACPIRAVTIVDKGSPPGSDFVGEFTMARIRRHANQLPNVVFRLASKSAAHLAVDALHD